MVKQPQFKGGQYVMVKEELSLAAPWGDDFDREYVTLPEKTLGKIGEVLNENDLWGLNKKNPEPVYKFYHDKINKVSGIAGHELRESRLEQISEQSLKVAREKVDKELDGLNWEKKQKMILRRALDSLS